MYDGQNTDRTRKMSMKREEGGCNYNIFIGGTLRQNAAGLQKRETRSRCGLGLSYGQKMPLSPTLAGANRKWATPMIVVISSNIAYTK